MERCGANTKRGAICGKPAGWGTPYQHGRCKLHGGASPTHLRAAQRREAERAVAVFGLPRDVDPHVALLEEVHRAAGHVAWLGEVVAQLEKNHVVHGIVRTVQFPDGTRAVEARAAINLWVKLYQEERDRLVRVAKAAIDAGVAERQVRLAEAQAQQLAQVIRAILTDLGHDLGTNMSARSSGSGCLRDREGRASELTVAARRLMGRLRLGERLSAACSVEPQRSHVLVLSGRVLPCDDAARLRCHAHVNR